VSMMLKNIRKSLIQRNEAKAMAFLQNALIDKNEGRFETMLYNLEQALRLVNDPLKRSSIWLNKAQLFNHLQQYPKALDSIEEAIRIYPSHDYMIFKAQILAALHKREEALKAVEQAIAMSNIALYQIMKVTALLVNGRMIEGISHVKWILQHIDELENADDFNFLAMMIQYKKPYSINMPMIEDKLISILSTTQEPWKTRYIDFCIEHDLFKDIRDSISSDLENDILDNQNLNPSRKLLFLCALRQWDRAKEFMQDNKSSIESDEYQYSDLIIDLNQNKRIDNISLRIDKLKQEAKHSFIMSLWSAKQFKVIKELYEQDKPTNDIGKWIYFWVSISLEDFEQADLILNQLPFSLNQLLTSSRESNSFEKELLGSEIYGTELVTTLPTIATLMPYDLPYDKLSFETFNLLIKKLFPETYAQLIDDTSDRIKADYLRDETKAALVKLYGGEYKIIAMEVDLIRALSSVFLLSGNTYFASVLQMVIGSYEVLTNRMHSIISSTRESERDKILNDLSHNIKNLLIPVIGPLYEIKPVLPNKQVVIQEAIQGAELIREIVNAINSSYTINVNDLIYDIMHISDKNLSIEQMILFSLKYSISNMFVSKYFEVFVNQYYPDQDLYDIAKIEWESITHSTSIKDYVIFAKKFMFNSIVDIEFVKSYTIGNTRSSALKLMILFQEIIFNAVKYAAYVKRGDRFIDIKFSILDSDLLFEVSNSYLQDVQAKETGIGNLIIKNYAKILGCDSVVSKTDSVYSIKIEFTNYWRNHE